MANERLDGVPIKAAAMKRFLLFTYPDYYPSGGWEDFNESFDTLEQAIEATKKYPADTLEIIDSQIQQRVWRNY